ncbi:MAG TPA: TlpA disulfide reductase family protein [Actinomycetota bacterium]|nr:TlpA disulfide reductase family protein [Actinomycetota bacterium]
MIEDLFSGRKRLPAGYLLLIPVVGFLVVLGSATYDRAHVPAPGERIPDFSAPLLIGEGDLGRDDLRGKPAVINFWASWCGPCEDEAPLLQQAHETYGDRITFLGIDIRDARSDAEEFVETYGLTYPSIRDETMEIYADFGLTGQPETFFVDADGILVRHVPGPVTEESLAQMLDVLVRRDA